MSSGGLSRILVATDFSPHAERALEWAAALARRFSAELEIATSVYVVPFAAVPAGYGMPPDYLRGVREAADRRLEDLAARLAGDGLRVRHTVLHEDPSSGICALARELRVDLVALGTRGRAGLAHVLLGSVAERVARLAPCPVLTVSSEVAPARPLRKLLVGTDFSDSATAALRLACTLLEPGGSLVLAHAIPPVLAPGDPAVPLADPRSEAWARAEYEKARATLAGVSVEFDLRFGAADAALLDAAARHRADAIVIGTQGRTGLAHMWLGSVAERVIRRASLPVFSAKST
ncbi:MAG TPA: universal stress protein [Myxococcota bacterium]|nr:universal stress protein [Myxococcota bacterium]